MDNHDSSARVTGGRFELLRRLLREDSGQDILEYAVLAAFIGIAGMLALRGIRESVGDTYSSWIDPAAGTPSLWEPDEPVVAP
jgi:Flp pilus assembly pilin Flp